MVLPLLTLTLGYLAVYSRYMKAGMMETIRMPTSCAPRGRKGLSEFVVVMQARRAQQPDSRS